MTPYSTAQWYPGKNTNLGSLFKYQAVHCWLVLPLPAGWLAYPARCFPLWNTIRARMRSDGTRKCSAASCGTRHARACEAKARGNAVQPATAAPRGWASSCRCFRARATSGARSLSALLPVVANYYPASGVVLRCSESWTRSQIPNEYRLVVHARCGAGGNEGARGGGVLDGWSGWWQWMTDQYRARPCTC